MNKESNRFSNLAFTEIKARELETLDKVKDEAEMREDADAHFKKLKAKIKLKVVKKY